MNHENGRIKLSWPQLAWGIATLACILGAWYDLRAQQAIANVRLETLNEKVTSINRRVERIELKQKENDR